MKDKLLTFIRKRGKGIYFAFAAILLMILTLILYPSFYAGNRSIWDMMSWPCFYSLTIGVVVGTALLFPWKGRYAPLVLSASSLVAFVLFIYHTYMYISAAITGIDSQFEPQFFVVAILLLLDVIASFLSFGFLFRFEKHPKEEEQVDLGKIDYVSTKGGKALTLSMTTLLAITMTGTVIAGENATQINRFLKTSDSVRIDKGEKTDSEYYKSKYSSIKELKNKSTALCERAEAEGVVLLKNKGNTLPLKEGKRNVSLFSISSIDPVYGGTGSGNVDTSTAPTLKSALERDSLFQVNPTLWDYYQNHPEYKRQYVSTGKGVKGIGVIGEAPWSEVLSENSSSFASYGDSAIVVLSRIGGEGSDLPRGNYAVSSLTDKDGSKGDSTEGDYLQLSPKEKELLKGLKAQKDSGVFKNIVVLLNGANQIQADFLEDEQYGIDAALWIGTPGQTGFYGVAEILAGNINPSGKLSSTFWADHKKNPSMANFGVKTFEGAKDSILDNGTYNQDRIYSVYQEGVYVGYRYTETRYMDYVQNRNRVGSFDYSSVVTYPFGYGLSYTNFEYSNFSVEKEGRGKDTKYLVRVDVKNVGATTGKDVVEVYLDKPYGDYNIKNNVETPLEIVGYQKTKELKQGESQSLTIEIDQRQFASYDANHAKTYVLLEGDYYLGIGSSSHDAADNILTKKNFTPSSTQSRMDREGNASLVSNPIHLDFNDTYYSTSAETGKTITNLFDDVDWNNSEFSKDNKVTYVSRDNWEGTVMLGYDNNVKLKWQDGIQTKLDALGREGDCVLKEDNSEYPTYGAENNIQLIDLRVDSEGNEIPYDDELWDKLLDELTFDECVETVREGMRHNGAIEHIGKPECIDHNGPSGLTERYSYGGTYEQGLAYKTKDPDSDTYPTCYPSAAILAACFDDDLMFEIGDMIGEDALWAGYAGLYGPGSNIQRTPYSGRNFEYFSEDGYLSGRACSYETAGMENKGLYVYNKHCALNDQEDMRRGIMTFANEQALREIYLRAFELPIAIKGKKYEFNGETITLKGASGVMTAFNRFGFYWSGMSRNLITGFLREECGMQGTAVTDMWYGTVTPYQNAIQMLLAGTNLVDGGVKATEFEAIRTKHADAAWALRESMHHILYNAVHSSVMNGISSDTVFKKVTPIWKTILYVCQGVFFAGMAGGIVWICLNVRKQRKDI